jgi:hypothetical protein
MVRVPDGSPMRTQGLVEVGAFHINRLRPSATIDFYLWNPISAVPRPKCEPKQQRYDRMKLALHYQSLLDSGTVKTRAELARRLGVSRARVTQVLKRLRD